MNEAPKIYARQFSRWNLRGATPRYNAKDIEAIDVLRSGSKKTGRGFQPAGFRNGARIHR
jgi:hypothetical protein